MKGNLYARLQYTDDLGRSKEKLRRIKSGKISDVRDELRNMRDELSNRGEETLRADKMTFSELAENYKKSKVFPAVVREGLKVAGLKSHKPVLTYVKIASEYFGRKTIRTIKPADIERFRTVRLNTPVTIEFKVKMETVSPKRGRKKKEIRKETRQRPRKLASVNRELATLRRMLNFAVNEGWLIENPFSRTDGLISVASEKPRDKVLLFSEETRLLAECHGERSHLKSILICALDTAMRPDEIFKLTWDAVDLSRGIITVKAENTKTETTRVVGVTPRLEIELDNLLRTAPGEGHHFVFGVKSIKNSFRTACRNAGIVGFKFRDCRHTATTRMVNSGMPHAEIMKITGHTQLKTFLRYVNPTPDSMRQSAVRFGSYIASEGRPYETEILSDSTALN
jgi:integrase